MLLDRHLDDLAIRMGGFLRGFDDPSIHLGSAARFATEFRKIFNLPALHPPGAERAISYSEAAGCYRAAHADVAADTALDPVSTMILGLSVAPPLPTGAPVELPFDKLGEDITRLLRVPVLLFYLQLSDRGAFYATLDKVAKKGGFPLAGAWKGSEMICPTCTHALEPGNGKAALRCTQCGLLLESFFPLPMVPGVVATISHAMLREVVALDLVQSYQEEGEIRPLASRRGVQR